MTNRRNFLKSAAFLAASGGFCANSVFSGKTPLFAQNTSNSGTEKSESNSKKKIRYSCSSINYSSLPLPEACKRISDLGYEAIDIWSGHAGCPHLDSVLNEYKADGLKKILEENKLKLYSFSTYAGGYNRYAELLGKCGGGVAVQGSAGPVPKDEIKNAMKNFLESTKPLTELCEKYDSYLAIENHGDALLNTTDSLKMFVELNKSPRLGIALAPYHILNLKESVPEAIRSCGKQLFFIYMWQNEPEEKQMPGVGSQKMDDWLTALSDIEYKWYVNPFMHDEPKPDKMDELHKISLKYLKNLNTKTRKAEKHGTF
ncbi:MAG: sugar phosphate isomerase/epimerase family protein [Thermoguttaceae bacterium]